MVASVNFLYFFKFAGMSFFIGSNALNAYFIYKLFKLNKYHTIIHLAARVGGVHHNIEQPVKYFEENILMNTLLIKHAWMDIREIQLYSLRYIIPN